ncbi:CYTH domain-containing protein [Belnapia sp. F-4-1]|uniref:CYTH domain-containing protein n=1 Tax=Belnapia sp. F-4-1 TaxID=1545443 RepID=UPI0005B991E8|nr:CYTH domain-containing protein [Belnapia sp. F-4-1]
MAVEIERKFLLKSDEWRAGVVQTFSLKDGLIARFGEGKVRVRHAGNRAFITVKGPRCGISRPEYEYEIPLTEADEILALCDLPHVEKTRHIVPYAGLKWAVDVHLGPLSGIEFAEVELGHPNQPISLPPWAGEEVTDDPRYRKTTLLSLAAQATRAGS